MKKRQFILLLVLVYCVAGIAMAAAFLSTAEADSPRLDIEGATMIELPGWFEETNHALLVHESDRLVAAEPVTRALIISDELRLGWDEWYGTSTNEEFPREGTFKITNTNLITNEVIGEYRIEITKIVTLTTDRNPHDAGGQ